MKDCVLVKGIIVTQRQLSAGTHLSPRPPFFPSSVQVLIMCAKLGVSETVVGLAAQDI